MNIDEYIESFRQGSFEVDCPDMELKQRKDDGAVWQGSGYIKQGADGRLTYKLYAKSSLASGGLPELATFKTVRPGKLFNDEIYCDLTAKSIQGDTWAATRIFPSFNSNIETNDIVFFGQLDVIRVDSPGHHPNNYHRLHFFEELEVPLYLMSETDRNGAKYYTLDRVEFDVGDMKFEVRRRKGSGDTVLEVTCENAFRPWVHLRIQEALQFITARSIQWRARVEAGPEVFVLELSSPVRKSPKTSFKPPISPGSPEFRSHGWRLFGCFLTFVAARTHGTQWNPVAYHLHSARESTANSIDAGAVGVSVALEAIASLAATQHDPAMLERIQAFRKHINEHLSKQGEFAGLAPRLDSMLINWTKKRPQDTLHELAKRGLIQRQYIKSWTDLRNRHVHPTLADLTAPSQADYQNVLDNTHRVEVLIYQIIFHLLGYNGPFTDYGADGFPGGIYPLDLN